MYSNSNNNNNNIIKFLSVASTSTITISPVSIIQRNINIFQYEKSNMTLT